MGAGFAGLALAALLDGDGFFTSNASAATPELNPLLPKPSHFPAKAKSCIFLFMYGGPSQMDLFDYKPELQKRDGQSVNMEIRRRDAELRLGFLVHPGSAGPAGLVECSPRVASGRRAWPCLAMRPMRSSILGLGAK